MAAAAPVFLNILVIIALFRLGSLTWTSVPFSVEHPNSWTGAIISLVVGCLKIRTLYFPSQAEFWP